MGVNTAQSIYFTTLFFTAVIDQVPMIELRQIFPLCLSRCDLLREEKQTRKKG